MYIGAHLSLSPKGSIKGHKLYNALINAEDLGINAVQVFTKSPMKVSNITINDDDIATTTNYLKYGDKDVFLVVHSQYLINFCRSRQGIGIKSVLDDLRFLDKLDIKGNVIIHMGKNIQRLSREQCINNFVDNIDRVLSKIDSGNIILETSVRSTNDVFNTIEELAELYKRIPGHYKKRISFCIDICHIFASGYDVSTIKGMKDYFIKFDKLINIKKISVIHLNDSKLPLDSGRDRHEVVGKGYIFKGNKDSLRYLLKLCKKRGIPVIAETKDIKTYLKLIKSLI